MSTGADLLRAASPYLLPAAQLRDDHSAFAPEGAVELYHLDFEQVLPDGLSGQVVQRVFQIRTAAAAELFVPDDIWYDSARTRFRLVRADVWRHHRRARQGSDLGDLHPGGTGNQPRHIAMPPLRAGDRIDLVYVLAPDTQHDWSLLDGRFLGNLFAFRDSYPTLQARYVLAANAASTRGITVSQVGVPPPRRTISASGAVAWEWQAQRQAAFFSSADGPSITDLSPFVQVSGFSSWADMADWYSNVLARRAALSPELQRRLVQLALQGGSAAAPGARPAADVPATVARVWTYLSAHLGYRGNERGIHAYVPAPVGEVFSTGAGDCKDGALLLTAWLRAVGIEADVALVRTAPMGQIAPPGPDGHAAATMAAFDHALVYIPATQQWIDTTAPDFLDTELPASDQNSLALIVRAGERGLVHVPVAAATDNSTVRSLRLTRAGSGWLAAEGDIQVRGADAPSMRARYANPAYRRQELASWLQSYFPQAQVDSVAVSGVDPSQPEVQVQFAARVPAQELRVAWTPSHYANLLADQAQRRERLELPLRWQLNESWQLQLADTGACAQLAAQPPLHRSGPFGELVVSSSCSQGWFQIQSRVVQSAQDIAPEHYDAFRAFWQQVDAVLATPVLSSDLHKAEQVVATPAASTANRR